ncbi:hypothetical protein [Tautonia plasticadhaerens]|uniref:Uncharacterized protein n=1 Tax=Tautonia plasticadhaerens TaxID=2527974 RepID=A0A518H853_9BACT|nr:hypothetical protein [Tautonia plasticadhaerens]QDV36936.1 hypothetical protein ElP_48660 [Tautonia plasticadhaerens]
MATGKGVNQGKTAFVREQLTRDGSLNEEGINRAWQEAGNEDNISGSLVYKIRSELGLTGNRGAAGGAGTAKGKARPKARPAAEPAERARAEDNGQRASYSEPSAAVAVPTGDKERALDRVEDGIDDLIGELKGLGGMDEALEALRKARRVVVRSHGG